MTAAPFNTVLCVEDDDDSRRHLASVLGTEGFRVWEAATS